MAHRLGKIKVFSVVKHNSIFDGHTVHTAVITREENPWDKGVYNLTPSSIARAERVLQHMVEAHNGS